MWHRTGHGINKRKREESQLVNRSQTEINVYWSICLNQVWTPLVCLFVGWFRPPGLLLSSYKNQSITNFKNVFCKSEIHRWDCEVRSFKFKAPFKACGSVSQLSQNQKTGVSWSVVRWIQCQKTNKQTKTFFFLINFVCKICNKIFDQENRPP